MEYTLIADAGSTKTDWVLTSTDGRDQIRFKTGGLNALLASDDRVRDFVREAAGHIPSGSVPTEIHYYGAGCATPEICGKMRTALIAGLGAAEAHIASDLLGAARSLLGENRGIACILGTGSNSCLYDGKGIERNVPSLGFILGDEGSGAALGKRLVSDAFKGRLPKAIADRFLEEYNLTPGTILEKVYREPEPNRFLASLVPFLRSHIWNPYVYSIVHTEFQSFLTRNVSAYKGARMLPVCFTGSIAFHFADILRNAADGLGFKTGKITRHPMEGLIEYHTKRTDL